MQAVDPNLFRGKRVTVAGLGRFGGGIAAARWMVEQGADVLVTDRDPAEKLEGPIAQLVGLPIEFYLGGHRDRDFIETDFVIASPALPPTNHYLQLAKSAGVPITTEIRLLIERLPLGVRTIGITGTKGKSTTTKLLSLMLATKHKTWTGGNIGGSLLFDLPKMTSSDVVVLELSSYMLEHLRTLHWSPRIAVVTMLSSDHLEWHGSAEAYLDAKKNLLRFQSEDDLAIISAGSPISDSFASAARGRVELFSLEAAERFDLTIPGDHNQLNAQLAFAAARELGVSRGKAQDAIRNFEGLPHRLQRVHVSTSNVSYFNDSIATIPEAAAAALRSFPAGSVIQIVGGYDKHLDMTPLTIALAERARAVLTIGATGQALAEVVKALNRECLLLGCGDLETAVREAARIAVPGSIVLLSTGCASYDQFTNFEARGDTFARLAKNQA